MSEQEGLVILMFFGLFVVLMFIRNEMVFRYRIRALGICSNRAKQDIDKGLLDWQKHYDERESYGGYAEMVFSLHRWRFNQFYPDYK